MFCFLRAQAFVLIVFYFRRGTINTLNDVPRKETRRPGDQEETHTDLFPIAYISSPADIISLLYFY
jgi:hypothetical protein